MVVLATTWFPHGELARLVSLLPLLRKEYESIIIVLPPDAELDILGKLQEFTFVFPFVTQIMSEGRFHALQKALETNARHVHYADLDRLIRWVERNPDEWRMVVQRLQKTDFLIISRTGQAYQTHPQSLIQTEAISNLIMSHWLDQNTDVSAGSKGFSRQAVEFIVKNSRNFRSVYSTDAEWPLLLKRGGFAIESIFVDGLDWETADRYLDQAADFDTQRWLAEIYDSAPENWALRVNIAFEIIKSGLDTLNRGM